MKTTDVLKMNPERFKKLSYEEQIDFIETCQADFQVVRDLIKDRSVYRTVVKKLSEQLESNGLIPVTTYLQECDYTKNYRKKD